MRKRRWPAHSCVISSLVLSLLLLAACDPTQLAAVNEVVRGGAAAAVAEKQLANDEQRELVTAAVCETTLGAQGRDPDPTRQAARLRLCNVSCPGTLDQNAMMQLAVQLMQQQSAKPAVPAASAVPPAGAVR